MKKLVLDLRGNGGGLLQEAVKIVSLFVPKGTLVVTSKGASDEEKVTIIEQFVQSACQVCVDILCRFYFERETFNRRKNGPVSSDMTYV